MKEYRVRINNEKLSRTISADSFMNDGGGGITFYKMNNQKSPYGLLEAIRFISNVAEIKLIEDSKDNNSDN